MNKHRINRVIIFSKNRPIQLNWFLKSNPLMLRSENNSIRVLYFTDQKTSHLYREIIQGYKSIKFVKQNIRRFKIATFKIIFEDFLQYKNIIFFTDDCLFINETNIACTKVRLFQSISYRDGLSQGVEHGVVKIHQQIFPISCNLDYLFSVDGRLYNKYLVILISALWPFNNPNEFESRSNYTYKVLRKFRVIPEIFYFDNLYLINLEFNRVSTSAMTNTHFNFVPENNECNLDTKLSIIFTSLNRFHVTIDKIEYCSIRNILSVTVS